MQSKRTLAVAIAATTALSGALAIGASAAAAHPTTPRAPSASGVTVKTAHSSIGTHLVTSGGRTLYIFAKDTKNTSHCSGNCAKDWPPLITHGAPAAAGKAKGSLLGTTKRGDGSMQVTYKGQPLYRFRDDHKAGQTHGENIIEFGGKWTAVSPKGKRT